MNEHDSERMSGILESSGYLASPEITGADMIILNTCSIREKAEQKFFSELGRLKSLKDAKPGLKIAVAGCIAQQEGAKIAARAPYIDLIFGPSDLAKLSDLADQGFTSTTTLVVTSGDPEYHFRNLPTTRKDKLKAWVSIMYGCDNYCSYCVVPYLRGRERSRPPQDIMIEVSELVRKGYQEVTLLGQNVNSYGKGLKERVDFPDLLQRLNDIPGLTRIRFVTSHPRDLSDNLINAVRDLPKVCEALHLPVQSGSNDILFAMNRRYTREDYLDKVRKLREAVPHIMLTSDIIVGFPGEREEDFEQTLQLLREMQYDGIFSFKYSKRPGTAALKIDDHLEEDIKEKRLAQVLELQAVISMNNGRKMIGSIQEVLIDGHSRKGATLSGRTRGNKVVNLDAPDYRIGTVVRVKITSAGMNSLIGTICE